jgi:hypothetical protein
LQSALQVRSERVLLEESTAAEQAAARARNDSGAGLELRPGFSKDEASLAVRLYLPSRLTQGNLREQLRLVAESESLRIDALEWQELLAVYRNFCTYRMLDRQRELFGGEISYLAVQLEQVDLAVQQHQFSSTERTKLVGQYLDLVNAQDEITIKILDLRQQLQRVLGFGADLDAFARTARIVLPGELEFDALLALALENRADYRRMGVEAESQETAATLARSEDGFRFKYIQSEYSVDQSGDGEDSWNVSAAFTLPGCNRNPDLAVYRRKQQLAISAMALQRRLMEERLRSLLQTSQSLDDQLALRTTIVEPRIQQLKADLAQMEGGPLVQLGDRLSIRERLLDTELQTVRLECEREKLAVDLVREIGTPDL